MEHTFDFDFRNRFCQLYLENYGEPCISYIGRFIHILVLTRSKTVSIWNVRNVQNEKEVIV